MSRQMTAGLEKALNSLSLTERKIVVKLAKDTNVPMSDPLRTVLLGVAIELLAIRAQESAILAGLEPDVSADRDDLDAA